MRDYLNEYLQFDKKYDTEEKCRKYLFWLRWPNDFYCPNCGHDKKDDLSPIKYRCTKCRENTNLYDGTIFANTRKPLTSWFRAIWYISAGGTEVNEMQLVSQIKHRRIALKWYDTLRDIIEKFREIEFQLHGETAFDRFMEYIVNSQTISDGDMPEDFYKNK